MGIFKRKRREAETELVEEVADQELEQLEDSEPLEDSEQLEASEPLEDLEERDESEESEADEPAFDRVGGPFDAAEVQPDGSRLDLGALLVPAIPGMQLNVEVDEAAQTVNAVHLALGGSYVQMQAFAAPRSSGVWADIRTEIAQSITAQGGSAEIVDGPLGREISARMPGNAAALRFFGVDGPRWFLRAVVSGPAATEEPAAERLVEAVKATVVVRGADAMAPRELLPLRMPQPTQPPEPDPGLESGLDAGPDSSPEPSPAGRTADDLKPFERGPEITEVR